MPLCTTLQSSDVADRLSVVRVVGRAAAANAEPGGDRAGPHHRQHHGWASGRARHTDRSCAYAAASHAAARAHASE